MPASSMEVMDSQAGFKALDYLVVAVYFGGLVLIGLILARREHSTDDYFRGGRRIPWYAAGMSILATKLSAVSFLGIPGKAYETNWQYILVPFANVAVAYFVIRWFLPFFIRLNVTSAYEYLEKRFNLAVRLLGSVNFMLFEVLRMGLLLLVPAIIISVATGMNLYLSILFMGVVATVYTVLGGIEAVVWTDVVQVLVLVGGALVALVAVVLRTEAGVDELVTSAAAQGKFHALDWNLDLTKATVWVFVLFWAGNVKTFIANQTVIQRYISTANEREAGKSIWISALLGIPVTVVSLAVGTALFVFYQAHPERLDPSITQLDAIFPRFIILELPAGISGLIVAGALAAAMSSLDSGINSMSAVIVTDFYRRFSRTGTDLAALRLGRILTAVLGVGGTVTALFLGRFQFESLFDQLLAFLGLFGGGLAGVYLLGMLTIRATSTGVLIGFFCSAVVQYVVKTSTPLHFFTYGATGMASCFLIGYVTSWLLPGKTEEQALYGLTVHTMQRRIDLS